MQLRVIHMLTVSIKSDVHYSIAPCIVPTFFVLFNFDLRRWYQKLLPEIAVRAKTRNIGLQLSSMQSTEIKEMH